MQSFTFILIHFILLMSSHVFTLLKFWISILSSKVPVFPPLFRAFFLPLFEDLIFSMKVHCNDGTWISLFLALTGITGPHVFWGDHRTWSHLVLHKYGQPQCGSVKLSSPLPPPVGLLSISIQKFPLLSPLSTCESMADATRFQATGTVVSPRSSCLFCCPESLKVLQLWVFSSKIRGEYILRTPVFYMPRCPTAF